MLVQETEDTSNLQWMVSDLRGLWFEAELSRKDFSIVKASDRARANYLAAVLLACRDLNPFFLKEKNGWRVENIIEFDRNWGMGSSSSFLNNLASWAHIDPFVLHQKISSGSGYDIACAATPGPIVFEKINDRPTHTAIEWLPSGYEKLGFVYLGEKQSTEKSLLNFSNIDIPMQKVRELSIITDEFCSVSHTMELIPLIERHEVLIGRILGETPIKDRVFKDFNGAIKSLGAWGGDFVMVVCKGSIQEAKDYFISKSFEPFFSWSDLL